MRQGRLTAVVRSQSPGRCTWGRAGKVELTHPRGQRTTAPDAILPRVHPDPQGNPGRRAGGQPCLPGARRLPPPARRGHLQPAAARLARHQEDRGHRPRRDEPRRRRGGADAGLGAGRAVAGVGPLAGLRPGAAPLEGSQGRRVLHRPDPRGGHRRHGPARHLELPRPAAEPVPDPVEVPRREAAARRAHARPRVHHEGRLLVRSRRGRRAQGLRRDVRGVRPDLQALRARLPRGRGRHRRDRRLALARVPGAGRVGRGRDRLV